MCWSSTDSVKVERRSDILNKRPPMKTGTKVAIGVVVAALAIGAVVAAYYLSPGMHSWVNSHIITPLSTQHVTLLVVGLSILGVGGISLLLYGYKNRHRLHSTQKTYGIEGGKTVYGYPPRDKTSTNPKLKKAIAGVALLAILAAGSVLAYHLIPALNSTQTTLGQSLLYVGLPVAGVTLLVNLAVMAYKDKKKPYEPPKDWHGDPIYNGT